MQPEQINKCVDWVLVKCPGCSDTWWTSIIGSHCKCGRYVSASVNKVTEALPDATGVPA